MASNYFCGTNNFRKSAAIVASPWQTKTKTIFLNSFAAAAFLTQELKPVYQMSRRRQNEIVCIAEKKVCTNGNSTG